MVSPYLRPSQGQVAIVTGASNGIGVQTTKYLAQLGARVVLAVRNVEAGESVAASLRTALGLAKDSDRLKVMAIDLSDLRSVDAFVAAFLATESRLDLLINNAGVMFTPKTKTAQGFEMQFGTNHVGHYYLTERLLPLLLSQDRPARILCVSSLGHRFYPGFQLDDLNWEKRKYHPRLAYGQSKCCNILQALELADRLKGTQVTPISLHPGEIHSTGLAKHDGLIKFTVQVLFRPFMMNVNQGSATTIRGCIDPDVVHRPGQYYKYAQPAPEAASTQARDPALARALKVKVDALLSAAGFAVPSQGPAVAAGPEPVAVAAAAVGAEPSQYEKEAQEPAEAKLS